MINIADVLAAKFAGKRWSIIEDDYETIEWLDESPKPSIDELVALLSIVKEEIRQEEDLKLIKQQELMEKRNRLLEHLGITAEEAGILFGRFG
jgi:hypothetical protein